MFRLTRKTSSRNRQAIRGAAALGVAAILSACSIAERSAITGSEPPLAPSPLNFDTALKQNEAALAQRSGPADLRLYNIGFILAHPSNPKRDPARALQTFRTLLAEHPRSGFVEQAKSWTVVLEEQQKLALERHKLNEEKRALARQRELLAQERQKLHYANEKSQQLDMDIEKRRRQSLGK